MEFSPSHSSPLPQPRFRIRPGAAFWADDLARCPHCLRDVQLLHHRLRPQASSAISKFLGIPWATILAIAFCGIDFAGIARLFTPSRGANEPPRGLVPPRCLAPRCRKTPSSPGGVSPCVHLPCPQSTAVISAKTLTTAVPIFVALVVWVTRILIIGTLSVAGERIFSTEAARPAVPLRLPFPFRPACRSRLPACPPRSPPVAARSSALLPPAPNLPATPFPPLPAHLQIRGIT